MRILIAIVTLLAVAGPAAPVVAQTTRVSVGWCSRTISGAAAISSLTS